MSDFSSILKDLRAATPYKQSDMANFLSISIQSYSAYENGREPNYDTLIKLSEFFNVSTDYLLGVSPAKWGSIKDYDSINKLINSERFSTIVDVVQKAIVDKKGGQEKELLDSLDTAFANFGMYFENIKQANTNPNYFNLDLDYMLPVLNVLYGIKNQPLSYHQLSKIYVDQPQINAAIRSFIEFIYRYTLYTFDFSRLEKIQKTEGD